MDLGREIQQRLLSLREEPFKQFQHKLIPTVEEQAMLGVRVPALRALAKEYAGHPGIETFMAALPHAYFEENMLHALLIERLADFDQAMEQTQRFLPYVDNWATCDILGPKAFKKEPQRLLAQVQLWLRSGQVYTVRFGLDMLLAHFLDANFTPDILILAASVPGGEYYIEMAAAWLFSFALIKQYQAALPYLEQRKLSAFVHKKTIQKAVESYRLTDAQKTYLKTLR